MKYFFFGFRLIFYVAFVAILMWKMIAMFLNVIWDQRSNLINGKRWDYDEHYVKYNVLISLFLIFSQITLWDLGRLIPFTDNPYRYNLKYVMVTALLLIGVFVLATAQEYLRVIRTYRYVHYFKRSVYLMWLDLIVIYGVLVTGVLKLHLTVEPSGSTLSLRYSLYFILAIFWLSALDWRIFQSMIRNLMSQSIV